MSMLYISPDQIPDREKTPPSAPNAPRYQRKALNYPSDTTNENAKRGGHSGAPWPWGQFSIFFFFIFGFFLNFSGVLVANTQTRRPNEAARPPTDARELATNWGGRPTPQLATEPPNGALELVGSLLKSLYLQGAQGRNRYIFAIREVVYTIPD